MMTTIRFVPDAEGNRVPDIQLGDLCSFHVSQAGWLRVELRNPANSGYHETRHYPPHMIESVTEVQI